MELNVLLRGQSNAGVVVSSQDWPQVAARVQALLGFDGVTNTVNLLGGYTDPNGNNSIVGGTAFVGDWEQPDGSGGWTDTTLENGLLTYAATLPADQRAAPTAVVWLHNEYDSTNPNLTTPTWTSAVRADAQQLRATLGQSAATVPYVFVNAIPYGDNVIDSVNQGIKLGMEQLADDPSFHAVVGVQADDLNMDGDAFGGGVAGDYGGPHMDDADANLIDQRIAVAVAQTFAAYALPGSPVALGQVDAYGPLAVAAQVVGTQQVLVTSALDHASLSPTLDATAANGVGWTIQDNGQTLSATAATVTDGNHVLLSFAAPVPTDAAATLYYAYGYGRIAATGNDPGEGNAIYDTQSMPIWTPATGLHVTSASAATAAVPTTPTGSVTATAGTAAQSVVQSVTLPSAVSDVSSTAVGLTAALPNAFLLAQPDTPSLTASGDGSVLDGGRASLTMTASGAQALFVVDAGGTAAVTDTLVGFHAGDELIVWGGLGDTLQGSWSAGAAGAVLTVHGAAGGTLASLSFANVTLAQAQALHLATGSAGGLAELAVTT